jgi:uridine phosphorylase
MKQKSDRMAAGPESASETPEFPPSTGAAIINPVRGKREASVSSRVILTFVRPDYEYLCRLVQAEASPRHLWECAFREGLWEGQPITIVAPAMGAPYAVMVLEKLIALGAKMVLAFGWCGSLQPGVSNGDLLLPTLTVPGEGTSGHYSLGDGDPTPDAALTAKLRQSLKDAELSWHAGPIWTTDAVFRETPELVQRYQAQGVLGVEMEMSALFAVGRFRQVPVAGLLVVSDELATLTWQPGYRSERFRQAREQAARLVLNAAAQWDADHV